MRKRLLLLTLALMAVAGAFYRPAEAAGHACPACTTYPDGSQCCVSCWCDGSGRVVWCTDNFCPESP